MTRPISSPSGAALRPLNPNPAILEAAAAELERRAGGGISSGWRVLGRVERPRSTLFRLQIQFGENLYEAFYKTDKLSDAFAPSQREDRFAFHRRALEIEQQLTPALQRGFSEIGVRFDEAIAISPDELAAVRLMVPGSPLGKAIRYAVPGRRDSAIRAYETIGAAIRVIEQVGEVPMPDELPGADIKMSRELDRASALLTTIERQRLGQVIANSLESVDSERTWTWTHGDISETNILRSRDAVGLIDFSWTARLEGYATAQLIYRIETESPRAPRWTATVTEALLRGYGVDACAPTPSWRLAYLQRGLQAMRKDRSRHKNWGRQAVDEILRDT